MAEQIAVALETGAQRVFASALDWPGWARSGKDAEKALDALLSYGPRYKEAVGASGRALVLPGDVKGFKVAERLKGNVTTDFGAPGVPPKADRAPVDAAELKRLEALLKASWRTFDRIAAEHAGADLRKGPRGGGRDLEKIREHVLGAEEGYSRMLGADHRNQGRGTDAELKSVRAAFVVALRARATGAPPPRPRRSGTLWTARYAVRRTAWHALDHAWEIEDRVV